MNPEDIARMITEDPDILNEDWEELGIEDPGFVELTPDEKEYAIGRVGKRAPEDEKADQLEFIRKMKAQYLELLKHINNHHKLKHFFRQLEGIVQSYGQKLGFEERYPYLFVWKDGEKYYRHYNVEGLTSAGKYDDVLFHLDFTIVGDEVTAKVSSYWTDKGETFDPTPVGDVGDMEKFFRKKGFDVDYKKFSDPTLNGISFYCKLFPQIRTEFGEDPAKRQRRKALLKLEKYGFYHISVWMPMDGSKDAYKEWEPGDEKDWSKDEYKEWEPGDEKEGRPGLTASRSDELWVEAGSAKEAIGKIESIGGDINMELGGILDYKSPNEFDGRADL